MRFSSCASFWLCTCCFAVDILLTSAGIGICIGLFYLYSPPAYFLVHDWDCPFEEMAHFTLLDRSLRVLSSRAMGAPYASWLLIGLRAIDSSRFEVTFAEGDRWSISLRPWGVRYLYPRIVLRRLTARGAMDE